MQIILNETAHAEQLLAADTKLNVSELQLLARYYFHKQGLTAHPIYLRLAELAAQRDSSFGLGKWQPLLLKLAKEAKKRPLTEISHIPVTQKELDVIGQIKKKPLRRLAFTLLCLAKYRNAVRPENGNWLNYEYKDIFRISNISVSIQEQCSMIHQLHELGLIHMNHITNSLSIRVEFIDQEDAAPILKIQDFRTLGFEYRFYCREAFYRCAHCGLLCKRTSNRARYCKDCSAAVIRENKSSWFNTQRAIH